MLMPYSLSRRHDRQRGAALVEASLIFILALGLLMGLVDVGEMLFIHQTVTDHVRAAARWAAVNPYDPTSTTNMVLYGTTTAGTSGLFGMTSSNVTISHDTSDGLYADRIGITVSGYSYLFFSGSIVNAFYGSG